MEQLKHIIKRFTIIDLLGMAVPGAMLVLAWNFYFGGITAPVEHLFGESGIALTLYFVVISYLAGMLVQEISKPLEKLLSSGVKSVNEEWQNNSAVKRYYSKKFGEKDSEKEMERKVFLFVSDLNINESKLDLFHSFYSMARNSIAAIAVIVLLWLASRCAYCKEIIEEYDILLMGLCFVPVMWVRGCRFYALTQERAYRDFLNICENSERVHVDE